MGLYSKEYTLGQMRNLGYLKLKDVPQKYRTGHKFYFRFYDAGTSYASASLNVAGRTKGMKGTSLVRQGLKTFKYPSRKYLKAYHNR